jgi:hypothetical protein
MTTTVRNAIRAFTLIALGLAIAAMGLYVGDVDDAPGAAGMGLLLMVAAIVLGVQAARNRLPTWAARTALAAGVLAAVFAAVLTRGVAARAPLFPRPQDVPSVIASAPAPRYAAAVERARALVRAAVVDQNLPGVSVALSDGGAIVWAEGFGWRDVSTRAPVTADTRFNIGTAAAVVAAAVAPLGLTTTGADAAAVWSPEHVGQPEEDAPPLTFLRHVIWQPLGLMPAEYPLPGDRATFYVPATEWRAFTTDPRRGRRLMEMRDLACCANGKAFYSTPSDLVRFAIATNPESVNGELAGGLVMSLVTRRESGLSIAVTSNMAYADTASLATHVADAFAEPAR